VETIVAMLVAVSLASERLVEIVKGLVPWLSVQHSDAAIERRRHVCVQLLAMLAGACTAMLALPVLRPSMAGLPDPIIVIGVGVLASGGSGLWNTFLTYFLKLKDIKSAEVRMLNARVDAHPDLQLGHERVTSNECYDPGVN
jgi:hypothetical protein